MIPAIGVMVAAYIVTRMVDTISTEGKGTLVRVLAAITILVALFSAFALLTTGGSLPR